MFARRATSFVALLALFATLASAAPAVGTQAPAFRLQDQNGKWHQLADYKGQWVVLYFYPKDATPGCTTQACGLRDNIFAYREAGAVILGVSVDDVESHKKFSEEHGLPFSILADPDKQATKDYGVLKKYLGTMELANPRNLHHRPAGQGGQALCAGRRQDSLGGGAEGSEGTAKGEGLTRSAGYPAR